MILTWTNRKAGKRRLPIVMYHRSKLIVNGKDQTNAPKNTICSPLVTAKKGKNTAILSYTVPFWFWCLLAITLLGWLGLLIYGIWILVKRHHDKN